MAIARILPLHGGASGALDMLIGLGPVILGAFVVLLATDRSRAAQSGYRDERPTGARLLSSGKYFGLEELLGHEWDGTGTSSTRPSSDSATRLSSDPARAR
jgi:hypothetical protein